MFDSFFSSIKECIALSSSKPINYSNDTIFCNTLKCCRSRKDLPFSGDRKTPMTPKTLNILSETIGISKIILMKIQEREMTIVRTSDPERRKKYITLYIKS